MSPLEALSHSEKISTLGELFPDGSAIDRLRQNLLVLWHKGKEQIRATVECNGSTYAAATLDSKLEEVLRLPARTDDFGTTDSLTADVLQLIKRYSVLDDAAALLVTSFIVSTWVVDCLPSAPCLNVWGAGGRRDHSAGVVIVPLPASSACGRTFHSRSSESPSWTRPHPHH